VPFHQICEHLIHYHQKRGSQGGQEKSLPGMKGIWKKRAHGGNSERSRNPPRECTKGVPNRVQEKATFELTSDLSCINTIGSTKTHLIRRSFI